VRGAFRGVLREKETTISETQPNLAEDQIKELFRRIDTNGDSVLSKSELMDALSQFGFSPDRSESIVEDALRRGANPAETATGLDSWKVATSDGERALNVDSFTRIVMPILMDQLGVNVCLLPLDEDGNFDPDSVPNLR